VRRRDDSQWLSLTEAASRVGTSSRTLYRWIRAGRLRSRLHGGRTEVASADLTPRGGKGRTLLDLFAGVRDDEFADLLLQVHKERRTEPARPIPKLS
jgi:excisionase family DNA binding protein